MIAVEDLRHTVANYRWRRRLGYVQTGLALLLIAAVIVLLPGVMSQRDQASDAELRATLNADRAYWSAWMAARDLDYRLCPPDDPAVPSVMVIVVENWSDKRALVKSCFRVPA